MWPHMAQHPPVHHPLETLYDLVVGKYQCWAGIKKFDPSISWVSAGYHLGINPWTLMNIIFLWYRNRYWIPGYQLCENRPWNFYPFHTFQNVDTQGEMKGWKKGQDIRFNSRLLLVWKRKPPIRCWNFKSFAKKNQIQWFSF
jgi:hypothetical protein